MTRSMIETPGDPEILPNGERNAHLGGGAAGRDSGDDGVSADQQHRAPARRAGLLGHQHPEDAFTVVIQLGTLAAVFVYFRADVVRHARRASGPTSARGGSRATPDSRLGWLIVLGTVPAVVVGVLFKK